MSMHNIWINLRFLSNAMQCLNLIILLFRFAKPWFGSVIMNHLGPFMGVFVLTCPAIKELFFVARIWVLVHFRINKNMVTSLLSTQ